MRLKEIYAGKATATSYRSTITWWCILFIGGIDILGVGQVIF
jgi:hypothetical protein